MEGHLEQVGGPAAWGQPPHAGLGAGLHSPRPRPPGCRAQVRAFKELLGLQELPANGTEAELAAQRFGGVLLSTIRQVGAGRRAAAGRAGRAGGAVQEARSGSASQNPPAERSPAPIFSQLVQQQAYSRPQAKPRFVDVSTGARGAEHAAGGSRRCTHYNVMAAALVGTSWASMR